MWDWIVPLVWIGAFLLGMLLGKLTQRQGSWFMFTWTYSDREAEKVSRETDPRR